MKNDMVTHLTLEDLIDEVDDCDGRYERDRLGMIQSALDGGHALTLAKSRLNHGDWLPWLKRTKRMGQRRAQRWMKLASTGLSAEEMAERGGIVKAVPVAEFGEPDKTSHISKMVLSIVQLGGPKWMVGGMVFEMWLGSL